MLYALNSKKKKIAAKPDTIGYCPECKQVMIPKCGLRKIWHWAHKGKHVKHIKSKSLFDF